MDKSVISIESVAITFSQNLIRKGFTKRSLATSDLTNPVVSFTPTERF